jgi:hypothetical protein
MLKNKIRGKHTNLESFAKKKKTIIKRMRMELNRKIIYGGWNKKKYISDYKITIKRMRIKFDNKKLNRDEVETKI